MEPAAKSASVERRTWGLLAVCALAGVALLVDGLARGDLRHRLVAAAVGALLCLPLVSSWLFGARAVGLWRRCALSCAAILCAFLLGELVIRVFDISVFSVATVVHDPVLGHVHVPARGGMDERGFRNPATLERASIVCIGDSQTFGTNVRAADTYPRALAELSGLPVYNMSFGGYGPIQHLALSERALELEPRVLVLGFYFGNDLLDAHRFAGLERWAELRDPELAYAVPDDLPRGDPRSLNLTMGIADGLLQRSRLLGSLAEMLKLELKAQPALAGLYWKADQPQSYDQGKVRTHWTAPYRLRSVDLSQADVRDGLRITELCLERMFAACRARRTELVLLLIHTKEFVYERWLRARGDKRASKLAHLGRAELEVTERILALAQARALRVVDPTPEMLAALEEDRPLWPQDTDGHFNPDGYDLIANVLWRELAPGF